jgi:SAM-dependent methyltransferase
MWDDAAGYEAYVGHWSRALAPRFLDWLGLPKKLNWLDVACGTGAVTRAILANCDPAQVTGLDGSTSYLDAARQEICDPRVRFEIGDARALPFADASFDASVSGLALNFIGADRMIPQQRRVTKPGGTVAAYVWDYAGGYEYARRFWDAALSVDARAANYDPGLKSPVCREVGLRSAFSAVGLAEIETTHFDDAGEFPSREDYWKTFGGRQGSTAEYSALLTEGQRERLREVFFAALPTSGPVQIKTRALAVKGRRP